MKFAIYPHLRNQHVETDGRGDGNPCFSAQDSGLSVLRALTVKNLCFCTRLHFPIVHDQHLPALTAKNLNIKIAYEGLYRFNFVGMIRTPLVLWAHLSVAIGLHEFSILNPVPTGSL